MMLKIEHSFIKQVSSQTSEFLFITFKASRSIDTFYLLKATIFFWIFHKIHFKSFSIEMISTSPGGFLFVSINSTTVYLTKKYP